MMPAMLANVIALMFHLMKFAIATTLWAIESRSTITGYHHVMQATGFIWELVLEFIERCHTINIAYFISMSSK